MALYRCGGGGGMLEETLLWTNPSPTSNFTAQTISVDLSSYKGVIINGKRLASQTEGAESICVPLYLKKNFSANYDKEHAIIGTGGGAGSNSGHWYLRLVTAVSDTGVTFGAGSSDQSSNNGNMSAIPLRIYGVK